MKSIVLSEKNCTEWDSFVNASDEAWLWHRSDHIFNHASMPGKENVSFFIADDQDRVLGIMPLHLATSKRLRWAHLRKLVSQGGPAILNDLNEALRNRVLDYAADQLRSAAKRHSATEVEMDVSPLAPAHDKYLEHFEQRYAALGAERLPSSVYIVDLRNGPESIWKGMETRARTAIRKSYKEGVTVRLADLGEDLNAYYVLHKTTYERTGARPHPKAYFTIIWQKFYSKGMAHVLFAERVGQPIAAATFGVYKGRAVFWTGASNDVGLHLGANALLQWQALQDFATLGIKFYETGKAFPNSSGKLAGLDKFKRSFGGKLQPSYHGRIVTRPVLSWLSAFYKHALG